MNYSTTGQIASHSSTHYSAEEAELYVKTVQLFNISVSAILCYHPLSGCSLTTTLRRHSVLIVGL